PSDGRESGSRKHGGFAALLLLPLETALISSFLRTTTGDSEGKGIHGRQGVFGLDRFAVQRPARALQAPADDRQGSLGPGVSGGTHLPQAPHRREDPDLRFLHLARLRPRTVRADG